VQGEALSEFFRASPLQSGGNCCRDRANKVDIVVGDAPGKPLRNGPGLVFRLFLRGLAGGAAPALLISH
jgi:hypothetical protein